MNVKPLCRLSKALLYLIPLIACCRNSVETPKIETQIGRITTDPIPGKDIEKTDKAQYLSVTAQ